jgi:hypothetical protein
MKTKTLLASMAVAGLVIAQPASAATRSIGSQDAPERIGSPAGDSEKLRGKPLLIILLVALLAGGLVVLLTDSDDPVSP